MSPDEVKVLVPYDTLVKLLEAPQRVQQLEKELTHHKRMIGALRGQLLEVMDKLRSN